MPNFKNKELDRTFDVVSLVVGIGASPTQTKSPGAMQQQQQPACKQNPARCIVAEITNAEDEVSLARIFADPGAYTNKTVKVRGTVVKVDENIMGKTWIHIQDETEHDGQFDLTVTTSESVSLSSIFGAEGTVILNKNFGYGYKYDIIMENATVQSTTRL